MWLTNDSSKTTGALLQRPKVSRGVVVGLIVAALFGIFLLDRATEMAPVQHLYYLPIIYAAVVFDKLGGLATAVIAIVLYHLANHADFAKPYSELDVVQIVLFVTVGFVAAKLSSDARRLHVLATTDDLTGLHNLRSFEARFVQMVHHARAANTPLVMLALDVDKLKAINDAYGHLAGADAVRVVGRLIAAHMPVNAVACRYGGDEFAIAIPDCTLSVAKGIGDELCRAVYASETILAGHPMPAATLSVSIGIADFFVAAQLRGVSTGDSDEVAADALFRSADEALYQAKDGGRNRVAARIV